MISDIAYSELNFIISKMSLDLRNKIPKDFRILIQNSDKGLLQIDTDSVKDIELHEDTKRVLSVLYTDYFATTEERLVIKNKERVLALKAEEEKKKKYNNNLLLQKINENNNNSNNLSLSIIKKENWFHKLFYRIKELFRF